MNWLYSMLDRLLTTVPAINAAEEADANIAVDEIKTYLRRYKRAYETREFDEEFLARMIGREKLKSVLKKEW